MDLDISCSKDLEQLLKVPAWIPKTDPIGFSNDAIGSSPKHPFLKQVIEALPFWNINLITNYPTVMISTGPLFLSVQAYKYHKNPNRTDLIILPISWYTQKYFSHHNAGSSWHSTDAFIVKKLFSNRWCIIFLVVVIASRKKILTNVLSLLKYIKKTPGYSFQRIHRIHNM